jgi:ADP-ribose pyrophosphatase YjhB (NUDIX family)
MANGEDRSYPTRPWVGVGVVVFRGEDVLLVKRGKEPRRDGWSIPGGAQEVGETCAEAAVRELLEETGLVAEVTGLLDVIDAISRDEQGRVRMHYTLVDVAAEWISGEAVAADDVAEVKWVPLSQLENETMWAETRRIIRLAAAKRERR